MEWILVVCTSGWVMCGSQQEYIYPNKSDCYQALEDLYKRNDADDFNYVICKPAGDKKGGE